MLLKKKENRLLLIFMRNPEIGKCKTRLAATIGDKGALAVYQLLLKHTRLISRDLDTDKKVCYSEHIETGDIWEPTIFRKALQQGNDLGERMHHAFRTGFSEGYESIIIIGSDMYDLSQADLEGAFRQLESCNYVLGPTEDGGYYLLGMHSLEPRLFQNKAWGSDTVLQATLNDLQGEKVCLLPQRNDIDVYEDIRDRPEFHPFLNERKK